MSRIGQRYALMKDNVCQLVVTLKDDANAEKVKKDYGIPCSVYDDIVYIPKDFMKGDYYDGTTWIPDKNRVEELRRRNIYKILAYDAIRDRYTLQEELALMNKGILNNRDEEYCSYRNFVNQCKVKMYDCAYGLNGFTLIPIETLEEIYGGNKRE